MKDRAKPRGSPAMRALYHATKGQPEKLKQTVSVLQCSWCKRRGAGVTWTKTPKGLMHVDCPERPTTWDHSPCPTQETAAGVVDLQQEPCCGPGCQA